jgi:NADPH:quinone reductase-like Zn-dependent oxidoreductase
MLAYVSTPGGGSAAELRDVPDPSPAEHEAVLDVRAFAVNRGELNLLASRSEWRPGQDVAGVVAVPAADGGPPRDTRVVALVDQAGWAQRVAAPLRRLAPLPAGVSFQAAAGLGVAGLTALRALRRGGSLLGKRVMVTGASGGVGQFAVQLAHAGGAQVTAVGTAARAERLQAIGADDVVGAVEEASGLFDVILESVGGPMLAQAVRKVAPEGVIVVFGFSSREPSPISFPDFGGHTRARIESFYVYQSGEPPWFGDDLAYLVAQIDRGRLVPQIGYSGSWRDLEGGLAALRNRQVFGKVVLQVD